MRGFFCRRWRWLTVLCLAGFALVGGVAYATIPDGGHVYTGCMLKNIGTMRLIDPSLPAGNLMSHCTALETQISWNQSGQAGPAGPAGDTGATGPQGDAGPAGPAGPQGPKGDTGDAGATGATGPAGPEGPNGATGATGAAGPQGTKGDTGATGATGATGPQGPKGDTGATGATGPQGATGAAGPGKASAAVDIEGSTGAIKVGDSSIWTVDRTGPGAYTINWSAFAPGTKIPFIQAQDGTCGISSAGIGSDGSGFIDVTCSGSDPFRLFVLATTA